MRRFLYNITISKLGLGLWLMALFGAAAVAWAADNFTPQLGQRGKDVMWVPTDQSLVEKILDKAKVTANDYLIELGSGDGRTIIAAAKRGTQALGIEYNPELVVFSNKSAEREGVSARAKFIKADIFESDFSNATVITMFLLPALNLKLRPKLLDLKPGTRIVSTGFEMGEWKPDETFSAEDCTMACTAHLWIVPAKVGGRWQLKNAELTLTQEFQNIGGTLKAAGKETPVAGRLNGEQISFTAGGAHYSGRVDGKAIVDGTVISSKAKSSWEAHTP